MTSPGNPMGPRRGRKLRRGLSLVEVTVSIAVIGVMMVAALSTLSSVIGTREMDERRMLARTLGEALMTEILAKDYKDPDEEPTFGLEPNEVSASNRLAYDDVDDYHGLDDDPASQPEGLAMPFRTEWSRSVEVRIISPGDFDATLPVDWDLGVRMIIVTVNYKDEEIYSLTAIKGHTKD